MRLLIISHKLCWASPDSPSGFVTDGGFPFQISALSELFDSIVLTVPCRNLDGIKGGMPLVGKNMSVVPLSSLHGEGILRKMFFPFWFINNSRKLINNVIKADAVHAVIPGDVGTIGMMLAFIFRKPIFVRYCGNWFRQKTIAEYFWKWFMETYAGGNNIMLATGASSSPPSKKNLNIKWIFSTTLVKEELISLAKSRYAINSSGIRLIVVSRQEKGKGIEIAIRSLETVLKHFPRTKLDIVGDGSGLRGFKELTKVLGLEEYVSFHGKLGHDKVIDLLQKADIFCLPTNSEGFPKAVIEALACGLPVISTKVSALPRLLSNGCGILIDEATPVAVAKAVLNCASDAGRYHEMSARAIEMAGNYSLERWRDDIGGLLRKAWGPLKTNG